MARRLSADSQTMRALAQLRELLFAGAFQPGARLLEVELVQRLGVSRSPLRMALSMLEHEGLIERRPTGGHVARAFTWAEVEDLLRLRGVLEGTAARLAAERNRRPSEQLAHLRECCAAMDRALLEFPAPGVIQRYFELDAQFDGSIVDLADSPRLKALLDTTLTVPLSPSGHFAGRQLALPPLGFLLVMQNHHRALLDAIERAEGTRAESIAREHWRTFSDGLRHVFNAASRPPTDAPTQYVPRAPLASGSAASSALAVRR